MDRSGCKANCPLGQMSYSKSESEKKKKRKASRYRPYITRSPRVTLIDTVGTQSYVRASRAYFFLFFLSSNSILPVSLTQTAEDNRQWRRMGQKRGSSKQRKTRRANSRRFVQIPPSELVMQREFSFSIFSIWPF